MISAEKLKELKGFLDKSENPLIFFDSDGDGLSSYLLLKQYLNRGKGLVVRGRPLLSTEYVRKIEENMPDYVFVVDICEIDQEFIDQVNVPIIWVDHHPLLDRKGVKVFNPRIDNKDDESPTTNWIYKCVGGKIWLGFVGSISDWYIPDFVDQFKEKYPDLLGNYKNIADILYTTEIGKLTKVFSFVLKGTFSEARKVISILAKIEEPYEILNQTTPRGRFIWKRYEKINARYQELLQQALKAEGKLLVFTYPSGRWSFSSDLSNELIYRNPDKIILVGRAVENEIRFSLRGLNYDLPSLLEKALEGINGYGGGHKHSCGGAVKQEDFSKFIENFEKLIQG